MATNTEDYVLFENSDGEVISNDPRWHAKNRLKDSGVDVDDLQDENARLREQLDLLMAQRGIGGANDEDDLGEGDDAPVDGDGNRTYEELDSKALSALVKDRGITIEGRKTVGAARAALIQADADAKAAAEAE